MHAFRTLSSGMVCRCVGRIFNFTQRPFPALVRIETTNACNAQCTICPHKTLRRPIGFMEETLYRRLIDECAAEGCREIHLHNFGEPLLDPHLAPRIHYAKRRGVPKLKVFSNGSLLTENRARGLIDAGLDEIKISIDGATREEFEEIRRPLRFDEVIANIRRLAALRNALHSPMKIGVACCSTTDRNATMRTVEDAVDEFSFGKIHNWGDWSETVAEEHRVRKPCARLWRTFTILADGRVALCCLDYDGRHPLGRIDARTSIRQVYHGEAYREARRRHREARQDEIALCRRCTKAFL